MTKRDFFRVLIKVFALYSIILTVFYWIPSNLVYVFFEYEMIFIIIGGLIFLSASIMIFVFLIKKTDYIIDFLKIDKGFDDSELKLSDFNSEKVLMLGIILIGGFLIISEFSNLIEYAYKFFKNTVRPRQLYVFLSGPIEEIPSTLTWVLSIINTLTGYLLLTNHNRVSKWFIKKGKSS